MDRYGGLIVNLLHAKTLCEQDKACKGVEDIKCNGRSFQLCPKDKQYEVSSSCIYEKRGNVFINGSFNTV